MSVFVIGDKDTVLGFTLVGGEGTVVSSVEGADQALTAALERDDIELLLVTREWSESMQERMNRVRMTSLRPVVVEIPGKNLHEPSTSLEELVKRAIGITI